MSPITRWLLAVVLPPSFQSIDPQYVGAACGVEGHNWPMPQLRTAKSQTTESASVRLGRRARGLRRSDIWIVLASVAVAKLTTYRATALVGDPLAWARWGRELGAGFLQLDLTHSTTSWKPLPVILASAYSPLGERELMLLMVTARAGAIAAAILGFRLVYRLWEGMPEGRIHKSGGLVGGLLAATLILWLLLPTSFLGLAEGLTSALMIAALERAITDRPGSALTLILLASLVRPELLIFSGCYGLWLWSDSRRLRPLIVLGPIAVAALWGIPPLLASSGGLSSFTPFATSDLMGRSLRDPRDASFLHLLKLTVDSVPLFAVVLIVIGALTSMKLWRKGLRSAMVVTGSAITATLCFCALIALVYTSLAHESGTLRYLLVPQTLWMLVAGIGAAGTVAGLDRLGTHIRVPQPAVYLLMGVATALLVVPVGVDAIRKREAQAQRVESYHRLMYSDLKHVIDQAGGREVILRCLPIAAQTTARVKVLWLLHTPASSLTDRGGPLDTASQLPFRLGTTFKLNRVDDGSGKSDPIAPGARLLARSGAWSIWANCPPTKLTGSPSS